MFTAGLLHDIGKVILNEYVAKDFAEIIRRVTDDRMSFAEAERQVLGFSHEEVGCMIAEKWKLPSAIVRCIRFHHEPSAVDPPDSWASSPSNPPGDRQQSDVYVDPRTTSRTLSPPGRFRHGGPAICGRQMETTMIQEKTQRLADLAEQLSEALMTAAICADEIRAIVHAEIDSVRKSQGVATETVTRIRAGATEGSGFSYEPSAFSQW